MIDGAGAPRVPADKTSAGKASRNRLRGYHRDGIMRKAARNRPLRQSEKRFRKLISKRRFRVGQCFGTMKMLFGFDRARYFGLAKTHARLVMAFDRPPEPMAHCGLISQNLLKAANRTTLKPQTPAIATS